MTRLLRLLTLLAGLLVPLAATASPCTNGGLPYPVQDGSGIGGTGHQTSPKVSVSQSDGRGMGGTGHARDRGDGAGTGGTGHGDGSGIGGTGHRDGSGSGGTGIEGFITGFGSVCVNGLEVEYRTAALPAGLDRLAVGQRVQIDAVGQGDRLLAQSIRVKHVVAGPVQYIDLASGQFQVLGQSVRLAGAAARAMGKLSIGERVKVSGLLAAPGEIVAYNVEPAGHTPDSLTGTVQSVSGNRARVGGVEVILSATQRVSAGQEVYVQGNYNNARFEAATVKLEGIGGFVGRVERVVLQDTVRELRTNALRLGPDLVQIDRATRIDGGKLDAGQILRVEASIGVRGELRAERIVIESREARDWNPRLLPSEKPDGQGKADSHDQEIGKKGEHEGEAHAPGRESTESDAGERTERDHAGSTSESRTDRERASSDRGGSRDNVERVERVERPERASRPERIERPERD